MHSIAARLSLAASLVLAGFVLITALALQSSVHQRAERARYERLQGLIYALLGASDVAADGAVQVVEGELPDARLRQLNSGLYAAVFNAGGERLWQSPSLLGALSAAPAPAVGEWRFTELRRASGEPLLAALFGVEWAVSAEHSHRFTFAALGSADELADQLASFDRMLWLVLGSFSLLLLAAQLAVLRWGLAPLRRLAAQIRAIEAGQASQISGPIHRELRPLSQGLNALLRSEQAQRSRYRDALDDLAHSLKTPLAVLRNLANEHRLPAAERALLGEHTARMEQIVGYQLQRAATRGRHALSAPLALRPAVERLARSLKKVFADKHCDFAIDIDPSLELRFDEGDLLELLGNLMENASKYGRGTVRVTARGGLQRGDGECVELLVEDDGPGFSGDAAELITRGVRADTHSEGQGIGLALAADIVRSCGGELSLQRSQRLGGAKVRVSLPR